MKRLYRMLCLGLLTATFLLLAACTADTTEPTAVSSRQPVDSQPTLPSERANAEATEPTAVSPTQPGDSQPTVATEAVAEPTVVLTATAVASPLSATPAGTIPEPSSTATQCPTTTEETWLLSNPEHGYCLLYPIKYEIVKSGALTSISSYGFTADVKPFVTIFVEPVGGRTAEAVADKLAADYKDFSDWIERSTISVGGEAAFSLGKLPGQDFSQAVFFVHDDLLYSLTLFPDVGEPGPKTFHDMVLSSFTFIPRSNKVTTEECFEPKADMQLLRDEEQGYCLLYFSEYQVERPDESETVLAIGSPHNFAEPRVTIEVQDTAGRTVEQIRDEIIAEFGDSADVRMLGLMDYVAVDYLEPVPGQVPKRFEAKRPLEANLKAVLCRSFATNRFTQIILRLGGLAAWM